MASPGIEEAETIRQVLDHTRNMLRTPSLRLCETSLTCSKPLMTHFVKLFKSSHFQTTKLD